MKIIILIVVYLISAKNLLAQEMEPRNYASVPVGLNIGVMSYSYSDGNIVADATSPIESLELTTHSINLGYLRTFGLFGKLARVQYSIPYVFMGGTAKINGKDTSGTRSGLADSRLKFGINIFGSPALAPKDFQRFNEETVFGASVVLSIPTGQYYDDKMINVGSHRWGVKPELGVSVKRGPFYLEFYSGVWFFTENNNFLKTNTLKQNPLFSFQGHISYLFPSKIWIAANAVFVDGGETKLNDTYRNDFQKNFRSGLTLSVPLGLQHSVKAAFNTGVETRAGGDFTTFSVGYQYSWF